MLSHAEVLGGLIAVGQHVHEDDVDSVPVLREVAENQWDVLGPRAD